VPDSALKESTKAVLTLIGTVMSAQGRKEPTRLAKHTEGVHGVVSRLMIGLKKG
jgi:osmotically-inducible protein OsmY